MAPWTAGSGGSGVRTDGLAATTGSSSGSGGKSSAISLSARVAPAVIVAGLTAMLRI